MIGGMEYLQSGAVMIRMHLALALALPPLLGAAPAAANPLERLLPSDREVCWERIYDTPHLIAHPAQKVIAVRLVSAPAAYTGRRFDYLPVTLSFNLRERRGTSDPRDYDYSLVGLCRVAGKGLRCLTEYDAGSWRLEAGPAGSLDVRNGGMIANPSEHDAEEIADDAVRISARPDDGLWRLSAAACDGN